jgi:hypothetical protein
MLENNVFLVATLNVPAAGQYYRPYTIFPTDLLLPAAAESLVQLNQRLKLIQLSLRQAGFVREVVRVVCEDSEIVGGPRVESLFGELSRLVRGIRQLSSCR